MYSLNLSTASSYAVRVGKESDFALIWVCSFHSLVVDRDITNITDKWLVIVTETEARRILIQQHERDFSPGGSFCFLRDDDDDDA